MSRQESYRWLFAQECTFVGGAPDAELLKVPPYPEVAFVGRSNVGKSSLLNTLVNRKQLARTSNTPGRTQQINFFALGNKVLLVDLPGYGYAKVPEKLARSWQETMGDYIQNRRNLVCLYVLVDARHGLKEIDFQMLDFLNTFRINFQVILTKVDKVSKTATAALIDDILHTLVPYTTALPEVIATSATDRTGINQLQQKIAGFVLSSR